MSISPICCYRFGVLFFFKFYFALKTKHNLITFFNLNCTSRSIFSFLSNNKSIDLTCKTLVVKTDSTETFGAEFDRIGGTSFILTNPIRCWIGRIVSCVGHKMPAAVFSYGPLRSELISCRGQLCLSSFRRSIK